MNPQTAARLVECRTMLDTILARYSLAVRQLNQALPGFPSTTPGAGNVGGGTAPTGSIVERLADTDTPDRALTDLTIILGLPEQVRWHATRSARGIPLSTQIAAKIPSHPRYTLKHLHVARFLIDHMIAVDHEPPFVKLQLLHETIDSLHRLTTTWGREPTVPARDRKQAAELPDDLTGLWCRSCLRVGSRSPRYRGDLDRWCYEFQSAEGFLPPASILEARRDGRKITDQMVAPHRKAHRDKKKRR